VTTSSVNLYTPVDHNNSVADYSVGLTPVPDFPGCPGFVQSGSASQQDQPGTPNVPDFKACSLLSSDNAAVQSREHCNWQIGSFFIAKSQMYQARRPTNNCHQIAPKCTKSHTEFQKFSGVIPPDARRLGAPLQTPVPDWESEKAATLLPSHTSQMHAGEEGHARPGWTTSRRGQDSPWKSQSE